MIGRCAIPPAQSRICFQTNFFLGGRSILTAKLQVSTTSVPAVDMDLDRLAAFLDPTSSVAQVRFVIGYQFPATDAPQSWAAVFHEAADKKLPTP